MSTVYLLDDTDRLPFTGAPLATETHTIWVLNCEGVESVIYGDDFVCW